MIEPEVLSGAEYARLHALIMDGSSWEEIDARERARKDAASKLRLAYCNFAPLRREGAAKLREEGLTFKEIGAAMGISATRARTLAGQHRI